MAEPHRGWWIVAGLFVVLTVSSGFGFYNLSVYMNVLADARGFSVSSLSVAVSLFFVVGGFAGMWVARLIETYDVRWVMVGGAALAGGALGLCGFATSLWTLYLLFIVFGIGNSGVSIIISTTLVTRWFPGPERSVALSVASTGLSLGGVVLTPLSAWALNSWSVEAVLPWLGVLFFLLIGPVAWWVVKDAPAPPATGPVGEARSADWTYEEAVRSKFFVILTAAYVLCMAAQVGGISHLYNYAEGKAGFVIAANAVQALTIMSIVARLVGGFVVTRVSIRIYTLANLAVQGVGLGILALADSTFMILVGAAVFGGTIGNLLMLQPLWLAEAFGVRDYPKLFSLANAFTVLGLAAGPVMMGVLHDLYDYGWAYGVAVAVSACALVLLLFAGARPVRPGMSEPE